MKNTLEFGRSFENHALTYLKKHGLTLIKRNYYCRFGELDLILWDDDYLVFTEVRYRNQQQFGHAAETVTLKKRQKIMLASQYFLMENSTLANHPCRFDIIGITTMKNRLLFDWVKAAFSLNESEL